MIDKLILKEAFIDVIYTNFLSMKFGKFEVIGYYVNMTSKKIEFSLRCGSCGTDKKASIKYESILKIKCNSCGRFDVVIPINYYGETQIVRDTVNLGSYKYNKLRETFIKSGSEGSELEFIRNKIWTGG